MAQSSYNILVERNAEKELKKLPFDVVNRILPKIKALADNPRPEGSRKLVGSKSDWRIRIGDYRVVYEIDDRAHEVRIMRVRHRREVY